MQQLSRVNCARHAWELGATVFNLIDKRILAQESGVTGMHTSCKVSQTYRAVILRTRRSKSVAATAAAAAATISDFREKNEAAAIGSADDL